MMMVKRKAIPL